MAELRVFFDSNREGVFFPRQLEVQKEGKYFHWVTNRALRDLIGEGLVTTETRTLKSGSSIHLMWHRSYRFYKRTASRLVDLVEEYADPNIGGVLGLHGEFMVLEGFARNESVMRGRNTRQFGGKSWTKTEHNLDFVFERDGRAYGIEVKNTLGYMDDEELAVKIRLCEFSGIRPVFAARMLPTIWANELISKGGYAMIMKYQLYPWTHKELARRMAGELGLPVDAPQALAEGTMSKFLTWHTNLL